MPVTATQTSQISPETYRGPLKAAGHKKDMQIPRSLTDGYKPAG
jgi:hypothetical protein